MMYDRSMSPLSKDTNIETSASIADVLCARSIANAFFDLPATQPVLLHVQSDRLWFRVLDDTHDPVLIMLPRAGTTGTRVDDPLVLEFAFLSDVVCSSVLRPLALGREGARTGLVFEDPGGQPLDKARFALETSPTRFKDTLEVACQLAAALHDLHLGKVIHGDVKPSNCFLGEDGKVWLTGFGSAVRTLDQPSPISEKAKFLSGTLAYMSPERSGRTSLQSDHRSDLYELGVTLFELFTGQLPFSAGSPMEWAHSHVARRPPKPSAIVGEIPPQLDAILLKLLEKHPDGRYQTARAVMQDLKRSLDDWSATANVERFPPARAEMAGLAPHSNSLFGRTDARQLLLNAAERVAAGGESELVLVSGPPGIGKSSLVECVHHILRGRGFMFASGKFDQHRWNVPYESLIQALSGLVRQLLSKEEAELIVWRDALLGALGSNAQLIVDLIPELEFVIGSQPAAIAADLRTAQSRFHQVFRSFVGVFANSRHPLVLFMDDLQWLDPATLELLKSLIFNTGICNLLIVGAYRDEEVDASHPLQHLIAASRVARSRLTELQLKGLAAADVAKLLANLLSSSAERMQTLSELVVDKTGGNPFFALQFTRQLAADGTLFFRSDISEWDWSVSEIRQKRMTDNVAQLLRLQLSSLPSDTLQALSMLSLLGIVTDVATVELVLGRTTDELQTILQPAANAGLVRISANDIAFVHDQVQTAAYHSGNSRRWPAEHLRIGRLLLANVAKPHLDERIFEIAGHFSKALRICSKSEAKSVANVFRIAGKRAKAAGAYKSAQSYLEKGSSLLGGRWDDSYSVLFAIELDRAECEIVAGQLSAAEDRLNFLMEKAKGSLDRSKVVCLLVLLFFTTGRSAIAVRVGVTFLNGADVNWIDGPDEADVHREYLQLHGNLSGLSIGDLTAMSRVPQPHIAAAMAVMTEVFPAAYAVDRRLMEFLLLRMVNLSLQYGNCEGSSVAYAALNMALGAQFGDYTTAYQFGELALRLVDRSESSRYKARVYSVFAGFTTPWTKPLADSAPLMAEAFQTSCSTGDLAFAAYNTRNRITHELVAGLPLAHVQEQAELAVTFAQDVQLGLPVEKFFGQLRLIRNIRGIDVIGNEGADEWAEETNPAPGVAMMICYHWVFRLIEFYLTEDFAAASRAAAKVSAFKWAMRSSIEEAEYDFYSGLTSSALAIRDFLPTVRPNPHIDDLRQHHSRMAIWANTCPDNFACREALLGAELAQLEGRVDNASTLYEKAILRARADGFLQVEALACELAGRFYATRGLQIPADAYLRRARECYVRWGCISKVRLLDFHFMSCSDFQLRDTNPRPMAIPVTSLDIEAVGKASKVLSSEMTLGNLIEKLMGLAIQHAGADRGALILLSDKEIFVEAIAAAVDGRIDVTLERRRPSPSDLPRSIFQYVLRTGAPVVLHDLAVAAIDPTDHYFQLNHPRSVLCVPVFNATDVIGLLYVENNLAPHIFSEDRISVLDFLASNAGIWLSNARLYSELQRSEAWLREAQLLSRTGSFYWYYELDDLECSDEFYRICEFSQHLPISIHRFADLVHPAERHEFWNIIESTRSSGADIDRQFRLQLSNGLTKDVRLVARGGLDEKGQQVHLGCLQDVSEMQRTQDTLARVRSELSTVSRTATLGVLAASITHEVSQPLMGIVANSETCELMLTSTPPDIPGALRTAERSKRDGHRAALTIKRLRSLFGNKTAAVGAIDVNEMVREVLALACNELHSNDIHVQADFNQTLPLALGDRVQIQQVVLNLLLNAVDAVQANGTGPKIIIVRTCAEGADDVRVEIADSGVGIDADSMDTLFDAFYSTKKDGMGLGLSVSKAIVEKLNGHLWATKNDMAGMTFSFTLKRAIRTPQEASSRSKELR
ncbi:AAA family ATPase [Rhizobium sp. CECT 9324]|uniref:trifunctional serine/threonine-protein kinase/ATP-binding protein/sensor histidine kinase n=1 Tax=Rhizobium sp. CECT 9324 TaxID=2845820 RepID=UPI001E3536B7|nr:AAA family ATPase [Rhizobium sp. CECT 9324]CAH0340841.1 Adaptive-response sensory-kinase SasA [Rhizobium sp. CECT 9324]